MIGWTLLIFFAVVGFLCMIACIKDKEEGGIVFGALILIFSIVIPNLIHYNDTISIPEEYIMYKQTIQQTKNLITNGTLNLADVEMNKSLAGLIKERNLLLMRVRANNRSPWALFKIDLKK